MGRPATYDRTDVLRTATALFQAHGFHRVSVEDLVGTTGVNRFAIYEKFGGKEGLFYETLEYYHDVMIREQLLGPLMTDRASVDSVLAALHVMKTLNEEPNRRPGCLIVNAHIELVGTDARVAKVADSVIGLFRAAISNALSCANRQGTLRAGRSLSERTEHVVTQIQAFFALAYISRKAASRLMATLIEEVHGWRLERGDSDIRGVA